MIPFFKKIRQKLLADGKLSRYLAYAVGEIILVVLGILIALKINGLQQEKQDRQDEKTYLTRLVEDLKMDCEDMEEANEYAFRRIAISTWVLAQLADSSGAFEPQSMLKKAAGQYPVPANWTIDSIGPALTRLLEVRIFDLMDVTYQEMVSTSKIQCIQDVELRSAINRYYAAAKKSMDTNAESMLAKQHYITALKSVGLTPNTTAASPGLHSRLYGNAVLLVELKYLRDAALRHLEIFEQPQMGLNVHCASLIEQIEQQIEK